MLSAEMPNMNVALKMKSVLHKLSVLSGEITEKAGLRPIESQIHRMVGGTRTFMDRWDKSPDKEPFISEIVTSKVLFEKKNESYSNLMSNWVNRRDNKGMESLAREIKVEKLKVLIESAKNRGTQEITHLSKLRELESQFKMSQEANNATKDITQDIFDTQRSEYEGAKEVYQVKLAGFLFSRSKDLYKESKVSLDAFDSQK
jgi:hypothetical protein